MANFKRTRISERFGLPKGVRVRKGDLYITSENVHDVDTWMKHPGELVAENVRVVNPVSRNRIRFHKVLDAIAEFHQDHPVGIEHEDAYDQDYGRTWDTRMGSLKNGRVEEADGDQVVNADWHINEHHPRAKQAVRDIISNPKNIMFSIEIASDDWDGKPINEGRSQKTKRPVIEVLSIKKMLDTAIVCRGGNTNAISERDHSGMADKQDITSEAELKEEYGDLVEKIVEKAVNRVERKWEKKLEEKQKVKECDCQRSQQESDDIIAGLEAERDDLLTKARKKDEELAALKKSLGEHEQKDLIRKHCEENEITITEKKLNRMAKWSEDEIKEEFDEMADSAKTIAEKLAIVETETRGLFAGLPKSSPNASTNRATFPNLERRKSSAQSKSKRRPALSR